mmetsp:Transcript_14019/g.39943  ORF Transcript_14019/g.39943 Transcript_14019/m.39943 type:complete len:282 (+) Transcript_14019:801-1646(+)
MPAGPEASASDESLLARYGAVGEMAAPADGKLSVEKTRLVLVAISRGSSSASPRKGNFLTSASVPLTAAAAAMAGDMRCVRPPPPCRPSKFLLEVDAQRSCGLSLSAFIARHMEHPGSLQSNPASRRILSRPSSSACFFTRPEPGTTMAWTPSATFRPLAMAATALMSSIRPFVQDPMNTFATGTPSSACPSSKPMYSKARFTPACLAFFMLLSITGTFPVMGATSCGLVPQVMVGAMSSALMKTVSSNTASSSLRRLSQYSTARSHSSPVGHMGLPFRYS